MDSIDYDEIGRRIRQCRKAKRLSQEHLAEAVGISSTRKKRTASFVVRAPHGFVRPYGLPFDTASATCLPLADHFRVFYKTLFGIAALMLLPLCAAQSALEMPAMPAMPSMPSMPNTDEKMAGRQALENSNRSTSTGAPNAKTGDTAKASAPASPVVPAPSSSSPISSFGKPLSDYSDIDELLQRLSGNKEEALQSGGKSTAGAAAGTVIRTASLPNAQRIEGRGEATILRFVINGGDMRNACRNVHFSSIEDDGSFLLTAERRYWAGGAPKVEPFYMLFTSCAPNSRSYNVTLSVVQEAEEAEDSLLSRLSHAGKIEASKTGNLVTMRVDEEGLVCDLLLDIGK